MADGSFDVIVIGSGPGGYVAAIRSAQLGMSTAVVERDAIGGRCLNYACIPAKSMLRVADVYDEARNGAEELGVKVSGVELDFEQAGQRRDQVIETLTGGVSQLFKKNEVATLRGVGSLAGDGQVKVEGEDEGTYEATKGIVLATGSVEQSIPGAEFGGRVLDTWGAWSLAEVPETMAVIGSGASGSEIASGFGRFGTEVHLIEMLDQILPAEDADAGKQVARAFKKQNINVVTGAKVEDVEAGDDSVRFSAADEDYEVDYLCVAVGRAPDVEALGIDEAGVETDEETGKITVDDYQQTSAENVYAIGDLVRGPALAHKASEEGVVAVERIAGHETHPIDPDRVPAATFCHPQVASIGMTAEQAEEAGHEVKTGRFKLGAVGAGPVYDDRDGFVKLVAGAEYGEILGVTIVGNTACDMIAEVMNVMALEGGYQELARIMHPHPTISEAVLDGARAVGGWAIHQ